MVVVFGASSFIGTYLLDGLLEQGRSVFATAFTSPSLRCYNDRGIPCTQLDMTQWDHYTKLPASGVEAAVVLAGHLPANDSNYDPRRYIDVNITGVLNVLEYCRLTKVRKIILASSHSDVAGIWACGRPITEEDPRSIVYTGDHAVYIITKIAAMDLVEHYSQSYGIQGISFRLPAVYGYGPHTEVYADGRPIVPGFTAFIRKAIAGEPIEIWGDPHVGRDMVYVKDVVSAFVGALDSGTAHGLYNIASGSITSLEDEVRGIVEVFSPRDHRSEVRYRPDKPTAKNYAYLYDICKARRDFGYEVRYPLMRMLEDYKEEMNGRRFQHLICREHKGL